MGNGVGRWVATTTIPSRCGAVAMGNGTVSVGGVLWVVCCGWCVVGGVLMFVVVVSVYRLILSILPSFADGKLITTCRGDPGNTFFLSFAGDTNGKFNFVTGGVRHMRFWNVTGHTMKSKKCILGQNVRAACC